jgi:predicted unusual protein kinase regulating ubiquinone biosynthesis (AarF/ABC1/UbiB family)
MLEFNKMTNTNIIKKILFLANILWIVFSEAVRNYIFNNNEVLITNITHRLSKINILFVKIFQAIAINNNIVNENINNTFIQFTDNAPYTEADINYDVLFNLANKFNLKIENNFLPINSGMISLVFKATKIDTNETLILKIKRNNIENTLKEAIDNLMFIVYLSSYFSIIQRYEIPVSIEKNINIIKSQTDFNQEIKNMDFMKKICMRLDYIIIPKVYPEVTEKYNNAIMMEFINGQKIDEISKEDYYDFAIKLNKFVFITLLIHGTTHGDLHGGNVLFIKDSNNTNNTNNSNIKIGLIDFGILYQMSKSFNEILFDFCTEIFTKSPEDVAVRILTYGFFDPPDILNKITVDEKQFIIELITHFIRDILVDSKNANQKKIYEFLFNLNNFVIENKLEKYGLKLNDEFIKLQMFIAMYQGVSLKLASTEYIEIVNKVINDLYLSTMSQLEN